MLTIERRTIRPYVFGFSATLVLLAIYFTFLTLVSGWSFAESQFGRFWYFIVSLAVGFGIQIGLYTHLWFAIRTPDQSRKVLAVSGTTSTAAMVSCCAHYLVNIVPVIGATGVISVIGQYQVEFFWVGLAFNIAGMIYIGKKVLKFHQR